jgi:hypothetical protein
VPAVRNAAAPRGVIYRVARRPDPLAFPPAGVIGAERFDDPAGIYRVLYGAEQRRACFVETLAQYRQPLSHHARRLWTGEIPDYWHDIRCVGRLRLDPGQHWLDLRQFETREVLRIELAPVLIRLRMRDLDVSGIRGPSRRLTQAISRWAHDRGYHGIAYTSRFDDAFRCWAICDRARFRPEGTIEAIARNDADLRATASIFQLRL